MTALPPNGFRIIAVDGGAASGKSSTSCGLAERLNLLHVDTGSHYRAVTRAAIEAGIAPVENDALRSFLQSLVLASDIDGRRAVITLNGQRPHDAALRTAEVNRQVSRFAAIPAVRQHVFAYQREQVEVARQKHFHGLVMEGRDIGTVILPAADHKFFLHADPTTRARRRARQGLDDSVDQRDAIDQSRKTAPLQAARDAIRINTGELDLPQVIELILSHLDPAAP